jgi:hypothetical protein
MVWLDHPEHIPLCPRTVLVSDDILVCPMAIAQSLKQECGVFTVLGRTKYPSISPSHAHVSIASSVSSLGMETAFDHKECCQCSIN